MTTDPKDLNTLKARFYDAFILHQTAQAAMQQLQTQIAQKEQQLTADDGSSSAPKAETGSSETKP
jgi:hypothetical protein